MSRIRTLADCKVGEAVTLLNVTDEQLTIQLYSMGCVMGEDIRIEKIAPFGDPMIISVENVFISLRKDDARKMEVSK